jgi:hypothetical protein
LQAQLLAVYAAAKRAPATEFVGPNAIRYAYLPATTTYWALGYFTAAPSASLQVKIDMQDGGDIGVFSRVADQAWQVMFGGLPFPCPGEIPDAIVTLWGMHFVTTCTAASPVSSASTMPPGRNGPGYTAARAQWLGEGLVGGGAAQSIPYQQAIADLQSGESTDPGNRAGYAEAIAVLRDLMTLPDANVSPAQDAEANQWTAQLDAFFGTPAAARNSSCFENVTTQSKAAATMWSQEPAGTSRGIVLGPLQSAVADLLKAPAGTPCYAAAIDDLQKLQTATPAQIAATSTSSAPQSLDTMLVLGRITYLNVFFQTDGALGPTWNGVLHS